MLLAALALSESVTPDEVDHWLERSVIESNLASVGFVSGRVLWRVVAGGSSRRRTSSNSDEKESGRTSA